MAELKTTRNNESVEAFLNTVEPEARRAEAFQLLGLFRAATGEQGEMWGTAIVGFGAFDYRYASGRTGSTARVGFSPRKSNMTVYLIDGFDGYEDHLARLGPVTHGKSCLHLKKFAQLDLAVLEEMVASSYRTPHPNEVSR